MDRKSKDMEVLDKSSDAVRVLLVDDDKSCHLVKLAGMLQPFGCEVTKCNGVKDALAWLSKDTSRFDIMITERNLPDMELLQKVLRLNICYVNYSAMSRDGGIEAMHNNTITIHGVLKPTTMNFLIKLGQCVFGKNISNPAEVQQPTNDGSVAKRQRFKWSPDKKKIFIDCVEELKKEGIEPANKDIMESMQAKGVEGLTPDIIKSHKQKWQRKLKKEASQLHMQGHNDKDGPSSVHVPESMNSATQLKRTLAAMNISSQHHIGAPQIMTQTSSSGQYLLANNPQNWESDETMLDSLDQLDFYLDFPDTDFKALEGYLSKNGG